MADGFVGEIRLFAGNYAPVNWLICDGRDVSISQYQALYSLIGITYGGDGVNTFALPDLCGRLPLGQGTGAGLTPRTLGQKGGEPTVPLSVNQVPAHNHLVVATTNPAASIDPGPTVLLAAAVSGDLLYVPPNYTRGTKAPLDPHAISNTGAATPTPHSNTMPCLALNFIICINGIYPTQ